MTKNTSKIIDKILCMLLVVCLVVSVWPNFMQTDAAEGETEQGTYEYAEDLKIYEGISYSDAQKLADEEGYKLLGQDLNAGNNKNGGNPMKPDLNPGNKGVYLAYKPTNDESKGITEITMLEMNVDYQMSDFQTLINSKVRKLLPKAKMLDRAAKEFAQKYAKGSYDAKYAYKLLDMLYVDEYGMTLADAIIKGKTNADFFNKVLVRSTSGFSAAIVHALTIGISDFEEDNWATRIQNAETKNLEAGKDIKTEYDEKYSQLADDAVRTVQTYAANYRKAQAREFANNGKLLSDKEYQDCDSTGDVIDKLCDDDDVNTKDADIFYLSTYEVLNQYDYDEDTKLGDYLVWAGEQSYDEMSDLRNLYPLVEVMTPSQAEMLAVSDITLYALYLQNNEKILQSDDDTYKELKKAVNEYNKAAKEYVENDDDYDEIISKKNNAISIWAGVNQAIYDQEVAITDDAIRYNTAGANYAEFTKDTSLKSYLDKIEVYFNIVQYSAGILTGVAHMVAMYAGYFSLYSAATAAFALGGAYAVLGVLAMTFFVIEIIAIVALVVWLVLEFIAWVWPEDEKDDVGEYTDIPNKVFDIKDISYDGEVHTSYVMYEAVKNQKGKCADLNNGNGRRWNALYYTNSQRVGNAIRISELEEMFVVQYGTYSAIDGYTPVTSLGTHDITNLNANTSRQAIYLLYRTRNSISQTTANTGSGTNATNNQTKYLETIKLYSADNETAAKALYKKEIKKGYTLIDLNMAKGASKRYTYLAYKLTNNKSDALTDIRVCNGYSPDENTGATLQVGTSTYGLAGNLYNGSSLWITSSEAAGTPIIGAPEFVTDMAKAKKGWEGVILASGGLAYDFNQGETTDTNCVKRKKNFGKHIYLYFNPSVKYTSGTEYVGGIATFSVDRLYNDKDKLLQDYLKDTGYKLVNRTDIGCLMHWFYYDAKHPNCTRNYISNFLAYSTTYNPYRAIYDVGFYESTTTSTSLNPYITTIEGNQSVAYNSIATYMAGRGDGDSWLDYPTYEGGVVRGMNNNNAYLSSSLGNSMVMSKCMVWTKDSKYSYNVYYMPLKGLYVKNHTGEYDSNGNLVPVEKEKEKPLVADDLYFANKKTSMQGYYPVKNLLNRYDRTEINLGAYTEIDKFKIDKDIRNNYKDKNHTYYSAYLYIRKNYEEKPRYISSISVCSFEMPELKGDKDTKKALEKAYKNSADDSCRCNILSSINAEMIDINVALEKGDRWTDRRETYKTKYKDVEDNYKISKKDAVGKASYIGVSRTNNANEAIRGIIKYKPKDSKEKKNPPSVITVGKAKYNCAGSMITGVDGDYYLYYTTNKGVSPCEPITDIVVDTNLFIADAATALTYTAQDTAESVSRGKGVTSDTMYYHCAFDTSKANAVSTLYIGAGNNAKEAKADLLNQGCTTFIDLDFNSSAGGKYIYLGYERYIAENIVREDYKTQSKYDRACKNEYSDAIKDIVVTVDKPYQKQLELNGTVYYPVSDVNLNAGTNHGKETYMYYTRDMALGKDMIVSKIGIAKFDRTPNDTNDYRWEKMLTTAGKRANLNDGCVTFSDGLIQENSLHIYMHRFGNIIKPGSEIVGGYTGESEKYGKFYVKK